MVDNNKKSTPKGGVKKKVTVEQEVNQHYNILSEIGRGAFSAVYLAEEKDSKVHRAIKVINKATIGMDDKNEKRIRTEVAILKQVSHPNIIPLYDVIETKNYIYLIMELVDGGELFDKIVAKGCYSEKEACTVVRNIVSAIDYLHKHHIVHRDLKPENLLVKTSDDTHVMISDFGLSRILTEQSLMSTACGTPYYVAPEIVTASGKYGSKVDLWSIGVVTYFLLAGFPPFMGDNLQEIVEQIMDADYEFPDPYWTDISSEAKNFVSKLLVVDPDKRMSAEEALQHPWLKVGKASEKPRQITEALKKNNDKIKKEAMSRQHSL